MKQSTTYQAILRAAWQLGWQLGTVAEAKRILLLLGENRFGPPDAPTKAALESIADVSLLEAMCLLVSNVDGWQALLGLVPPRRRKPSSRLRTSPRTTCLLNCVTKGRAQGKVRLPYPFRSYTILPPTIV